MLNSLQTAIGFAMIKPAALLLVLPLLSYACNTDETPRLQVEITSFGLPGVGEFEFSDDNILLVDSARKHTITIHTNPPDAMVFFSLDNGEFTPLEELPGITAGNRNIRFIASKSNYRQSRPTDLRIGHVSAQYLNGFGISPNPVNDSLYLRADNKSRGVVDLTVITMWGTILLDEVLLKQKDNFRFAMDVSSYDPGVYLMRLHMGSGEEHLKFIIK